MAKSTLRSRVSIALQYQQKQANAYLVFGKSSSWTNDNNPPEEDENTAAISEIIGYKKTKQFSLARPLKQGETPIYPTVTYGGNTWVLIPNDQAYNEKAHWLYVEAEIQPADFPLGMFRQVGVQLGVTPKPGVLKQNLLPSEVSSVGELWFFENREPQNRRGSTMIKEQFIIKV